MTVIVGGVGHVCNERRNQLIAGSLLNDICSTVRSSPRDNARIGLGRRIWMAIRRRKGEEKEEQEQEQEEEKEEDEE